MMNVCGCFRLTLALIGVALSLALGIPVKALAAIRGQVASEPVRIIEEAERVGLANRQVSVLFHRKTGDLVGILRPVGPRVERQAGESGGRAGENLVSTGMTVPLWTVELKAAGKEKPLTLVPKAATGFTINTSGDKTERRLEIVSTLPQGVVRATVALAAADERPRWQIGVELREGSLWSITYPEIAVPAFDADPHGNELLFPRRRGTVREYGASMPRGDSSQPYPGPSAKFQFQAAYGKSAGCGLYYAVEDPDGYSKVFHQRNYPAAKSVVLAVEHQPADRGRTVRGYRLPYWVVAGPFAGDWWHAARIYRQWWSKQTWAAGGLLLENHAVPDWLKQTVLMLRPSTTNPARKLDRNLETIRSVRQAFPREPLAGIWYGWSKPSWGQIGLDQNGHGRYWPLLEGLPPAIRQLRGEGVHLQAYVQSIIYDDRLDDADVKAARAAVTRDASGQPVRYGAQKEGHLLAMCRAAPWWQNRLVELSRRTVAEGGFSGMYLDSFGKGAAECFSTSHGHACGGGNTVVAGQRQLARQVREALRRLDPEAIMSGEDPIEAFRDLLDIHLYAVNIAAGYRPVFRTVWGDYSLGHGRVLGVPSLETFLAETALLVLEGTIPGRIYCDGEFVLRRPDYAAELDFLQRLVAFSERGIDYLRFGEYLHPLELTPGPVKFSFVDSVEKQRVEVDAVAHSVTRSHRDGSVGIMLVNLGKEPWQGQVPLDPSLRSARLVQAQPRARLERMDRQGKFSAVAEGSEAWRQPVRLAGREMVFWRLR